LHRQPNGEYHFRELREEFKLVFDKVFVCVVDEKGRTPVALVARVRVRGGEAATAQLVEAVGRAGFAARPISSREAHTTPGALRSGYHAVERVRAYVRKVLRRDKWWQQLVMHQLAEYKRREPLKLFVDGGVRWSALFLMCERVGA
jgi:hypothetical protein